MSDGVVHLTFPAKPEYLLLARLALAGVARGLPMNDETLADLKLAVTEACGNVVRHAYTGEPGSVDVVFELRDSRLEIRITDEGQGLRAPDAIPDDDPTNGPGAPLESGMGMPIIRAIVDELDVGDGPNGRGTLVRMVKHL